MAQLIKSNGETIEITPKNGKDFKWEELYKMIGGYIEIIRVGNGNILVVDEEGKVKCCPINIAASHLAGQVVVGDVVFCADDQIL